VGIILVDVPGIGEDTERHEEYIKLYKSLVPKLDLVLWAIKADDRKYMSSIEVYEEVLKPNLESCPVVFAITQSEKIEPFGDWNMPDGKPSSKQEENLLIKVNDVSSRFDISTNKIVAISSMQKFNLVELVNKVVEVLPNGKKYAFAREAKDENVSEEAAKKAEKGIFDHIKEMAGETWDFIKDDALDLAIDVVKILAPKTAKKVIKWFSSWF
jgi:predicted GTPase